MHDTAAAPRRPPKAWQRLVSAFDLPRHQMRRALREPRRLGTLHYSSALASLRSVVEPDECGFMCEYFDIDPSAFRQVARDLCEDLAFVESLAARHRAYRGSTISVLGRVAAEDHDRCLRLLYYAIRLHRPTIVVESGVFDGFSSAFILKALRDNGHGRLCSVDLPARAPMSASTDKMAFATLPAGADPGWLVPDALRARWTLRLGASQELLVPWLAELGPIDVFFHDSLHTRSHMLWEYTQAWAALVENGMLLSDDVFWSSAFWRFSRRVGARGRILRGMGFLRKPRGAAVGMH